MVNNPKDIQKTLKEMKGIKKEELDQVKDLEYNLEKDKVYLNWSKVKDADKYEIYLSKNGKAYSLAGTVTKNSATISYLD